VVAALLVVIWPVIYIYIYIYIYIQGDSGEKVNNVGDDNIGNLKRKKVSMNMCLILIGY
jgi:hypothetical protein